MLRKILTIVLTILVALAFFGAGFAKLKSAPPLVEQFRSFGYPLWFMYVTGAIEIVSAILLLIPRYAYVGCGILVCVMLGAIVSHLTHGQVAKTAPAIVLLLLVAALGSLHHWRAPGPVANPAIR